MAEKRPRMPRPAPASELLTALLQGTPAEARLREGKIWLVWESAVGKKIAERARPVAIRDGLLTVTVSSAPWMQQLTFLKRGIIDKLNGILGECIVRDIYLKAGKAENRTGAAAADIPPARPLSEEEQRSVADETAAVADPDLREALASLMKKHLSRQP